MLGAHDDLAVRRLSKMHALRDQAGVIDNVASNDPVRAEFDRLHVWSEKLEKVILCWDWSRSSAPRRSSINQIFDYDLRSSVSSVHSVVWLFADLIGGHPWRAGGICFDRMIYPDKSVLFSDLN